MKRILINILIVFFGIIPTLIYAQGASVEAKLDKNLILIGDHLGFSLEATVPLGATVEFPELNDSVVSKVEILKNLPIDTIKQDNQITIKNRYVLTCFDSGAYHIPSYRIIVKNQNGKIDSLETQSVYFAVQTFNVDSTATKIADIKKPIDTPLTFKEFIQEYSIYVGVIILILALVFTIWWYLKKQRNAQEMPFERIRPKEPAHVIALRELDDLQSRKLWQQDKTKLHYSLLSDIVRSYIDYRFDVATMEKTTDEILQSVLNNKVLNTENFDKLKDILELSDFVKFAKFSPLPDDNARTLDFAYQIVLSTKKRVLEPEIENTKQTDNHE